MDGQQPFIDTITANPGEDAPRLVFADWLEERGECARAEFIRVQIELEKVRSECGSEGGDYLCRSMKCKLCPLIRRQNAAWLEIPFQSGRDLIPPTGFATTIFAGPDTPPPVIHIRRGFFSRVQCTLTDWCGGPGVYGGGSDSNRGSPSTLGHAGEICLHHPIESVTLTDRRPGHVEREPGFNGWTWFVGDAIAPTSPHHVTNAIWHHMERTWHPTEADALADLDRAAVKLGRERAEALRMARR